MNHKNDCEISMGEFNSDPMPSIFAEATLKALLLALEISVTPGDNPRQVNVAYPDAERYAENLEGLVVQLEEAGAKFDE